ncbi:hypothetical protein KY290_022575 [Solanum tuberosum]|uniref:Uncharacterized protein n=1 Tax=Solanum tuberosum TaxID=4113 RepID=A0ABQ7V6V1_SOLTU|nr:hypothetical protein KY284_021475 [Solanum tuberosum]KAH0759082.1 hypothetical protein KY290_022575 [Solanum tuberosum]
MNLVWLNFLTSDALPMRLWMHPAAPLLAPHFSSEECEVAGYQCFELENPNRGIIDMWKGTVFTIS